MIKLLYFAGCEIGTHTFSRKISKQKKVIFDDSATEWG